MGSPRAASERETANLAAVVGDDRRTGVAGTRLQRKPHALLPRFYVYETRNQIAERNAAGFRSNAS